MTATVKFKILKIVPEEHNVIVQFYTDELVEAMKPTWDREANILVQNSANELINAWERRAIQLRDEALAADSTADVKWEDYMPQAMKENPSMTYDEAIVKVKERFVPGSVHSITLYEKPAPTGKALLDYIASHAPHVWLQHKVDLLKEPQNMAHVENLVGVEHIAIRNLVIPTDEANPIRIV